MKIIVFRRLRRDGSHYPNYSYKFTWHGQQVLRSTPFTAEISGSVEQARKDARAKGCAHIRDLGLAPIAEVNARFNRKQIRVCPTFADLQPVFEAGAVGRLSEGSARAAWLQILNILRRAGACSGVRQSAGLLNSKLETLNSELLHRYAQSVLNQAAAEQAGDRRLNQLKRSANSTWSTARMAFSRSMRAYYASVGLDLPPGIDTFCKAPPFPGKIGKKTEYDTPPDHIIAATFKDLEEVQRTANPNIYAAVHLALAFGLRKGEIIGARVRNITSKHGHRGFELCENWVNRRPRDVPKNGNEQPFIHPKNQSLAKLDAILAGRSPDSYILTGVHQSERIEYTFRQVSAWMRGLGWATQHTIHEFRAYAIAQVAAAEGIFEASKWARHSSVVITQANYGHHCKRTHLDLPIQLPEVPAQFTPKLATA